MYEFRLKMELLSKFFVVKKAFTPKITIKHNLEKKTPKKRKLIYVGGEQKTKGRKEQFIISIQHSCNTYNDYLWTFVS